MLHTDRYYARIYRTYNRAAIFLYRAWLMYVPGPN